MIWLQKSQQQTVRISGLISALFLNDETFQFQVHKTYHTNVPFFNDRKV